MFRLRRVALLCGVGVVVACADTHEPLGPESVSKPTFHLDMDGLSVVKAGLGSATVDGILSPGEWDNSAAVSFPANVPSFDGGGTIPATVHFLNDETQLYLLVRVARPSMGGGISVGFEFDNDHGGGAVPAEGDDLFGVFIGLYTPATFTDVFRTFQTPPCSVWSCGLSDVAFGGTNDGEVAGWNDGTFTYLEISHPLDGPDDAHDFSLISSDVVGFSFLLSVWSLTPSCNFGVACAADTGWPTSNTYSRSLMADLEFASPVLAVNIDVKPGSIINSINLKSSGKIPVAILSTSTFDATTIDPATVTLSGAPVATKPNGEYMSAQEDVDGDGRPDLVVHVVTAALQLGVGVVEVVLTGETSAGVKCNGVDWVWIL